MSKLPSIRLKFKQKFLLLIIVAGFASTNNLHAKQLLVFGDSLSAAYGMDIEQGWVHLLGQHWQNQDANTHTVANASISGETTAGGLARLSMTLEELKPDVVLLELGANDGLRGYPIKLIRTNLVTMLEQIEASGAQAIIAGISLPPSYGPRYIDQFRQLFRDLASERGLPFIDLFREDFVSQPDYIQDDGLHPTAITQAIIRDDILAFLASHDLFQ